MWFRIRVAAFEAARTNGFAINRFPVERGPPPPPLSPPSEVELEEFEDEMEEVLVVRPLPVVGGEEAEGLLEEADAITDGEDVDDDEEEEDGEELKDEEGEREVVFGFCYLTQSDLQRR